MLRPTPTSTLFPYTTLFRSISSQKKQITLSADSSQRVLEIPHSTAPVSFLKLQLQDAGGKILSCSFKNETRSEEHTSELQSRQYLVCRLLLEKKKKSREDNK